MLSKKAFEDGIEILTTEYEDFKMNEARKELWYVYFKDIPDKVFLSKVNVVIKNLNRTPFMADIYNAYPETGYIE